MVAVEAPPSVECAGPLASAYLKAYRPWMSLYGVRLQRVHDPKQGELSLIEKMLPDEMLLHIFQRLPVPTLATAQCVCRQWRSVGATPVLWRTACLEAFFTSNAQQNAELARAQYRGSWKRMLLERPHLRFDGVYVSRNTYLRTGVAEWNVKNSVHLVLYFRYLRFFPDGTFSYRTSPDPLAKVHRSLALAHTQRHAAQRRGRDGEHVHLGRFKQDGERVWTAMRSYGTSSTEIRSRLRLRSTVPGANNRLDIQSIVSWDREGLAVPMMDMRPDEEAEEGAETQQHRRGMVSYCFVPHDQMHSHILNLPVTEMDIFITG